MEINPLIDMTIPERLDCFLLDTFQPHTRHDKTMTYGQVVECYEQWCESMDVPVLGSRVQIGSALRKRFFFLNKGNYRFWFLEVKPDLIGEEIEGLDEEFRNGSLGASGD